MHGMFSRCYAELKFAPCSKVEQVAFPRRHSSVYIAVHRLKQATMAEQEDEEDKMRWRVEAEVRLAMESAQQAEAQRQAHYERELANLRVTRAS